MTNRKTMLAFAGATAALGLSVLLVLPGCSGEDTRPVAAAPAPPPPPPPPSAPVTTPVAQLMDDLGIDKRISMAEDRAPATDEDRKAVLEFFDAFARGDSQSVSSMLSMLDQAELMEMVNAGEWTRTTGGINEILVEAGKVNGSTCALGLFNVNGNYQAQLWYYRSSGNGYVFEAAPTPPNIINRLSGDWIQSWHKIIEEEIALGQLPDIELDASALDEDDPDSSRGGRQGGSGRVGTTSPGGSGGAGGLREPPSEPIKPPGT